MNELPDTDGRQRIRAWIEQPRVVGALLLLIVPFILVATFTMLNLFNAMLAVGTTSPSPNLTAKANP